MKMMKTKEDLQEQLSNLQDAIAEGALEVEFQGKRVKYRTLDEMRRIELGLVRQLMSESRSCFKKIVSVFEKF
ncbi:MAG: hypothetical protein V4591_01585 [Bdellovibrionota bacterium]